MFRPTSRSRFDAAARHRARGAHARARRTRARGALLAIAVAACTSAALAQAPAPLDPIAVTAARTPQRLTDLLADLTIVGSEEIRRSGAQSLVELLQRQAGVEIIQNGGPGATSGVFLRGANAAQTLVLIDGLRLASSTSGATALEALPIEQIDRIEILRGPSSSLYGADAIGGVIQVFTRSGSRSPQANASVGYGTYDTTVVTAGVSGGGEAWRGALQLGVRRSSGFNAIVNPANFSYDPDRDGYDDHSVNAQGVITLAPDHEVGAQYFRSRLDNQFDAGDAFDDRTITTLTAWQVTLRDRFTPAWQSRLSAGEGSDESVSRTGFGESPFRTRQLQYAWQNELALDATGVPGLLTLALERREEKVDAQPVFPVTRRTTNSVTAVYSLLRGPHALQVNLRNDDSDQFGNRTTGAIAYGYRITPQWRVSVSGGTAFKPPTFNDLYYPGFSNPNLSPETARNLEAGLHYTTTLAGASVQARALAWHNRVEDLIVFQCDASFACAPVNVNDATLKGVTLGVDATTAATTLRASVDFQSPKDDATGNLLPRRARTHGAVGVVHRVGRVQLGAEVVASSHRYDDAENTRRLAGYGIVNLTAEWTVAHNVTLFLRGDNVLDRDYQLAADFSTGGARVFGGVRWQL